MDIAAEEYPTDRMERIAILMVQCNDQQNRFIGSVSVGSGHSGIVTMILGVVTVYRISTVHIFSAYRHRLQMCSCKSSVPPVVIGVPDELRWLRQNVSNVLSLHYSA